MKDSMQRRCYLAEGRWADKVSRANERWPLDLADGLILTLSQEFGTRLPKVQTAKLEPGVTGLYQRVGMVISFLPGPIRLNTILHEFAHHLHAELGNVGRPHGGGYTEAMCLVVESYLGKHAADLLREEYRKVGLTVTMEDELEHVQTAKTAASRLQDRRGETGTVFVVSVHVAGQRRFIMDEIHYSLGPRAGAWKRRSTAEKYARAWRHRDPIIHEVDGVFESDDRWRYNTTPKWMAQDKAIWEMYQEWRGARD